MPDVEQISPANAEAIEAWDGVLFDRFVKFRDVIVNGLGAHGEEALRLHPPAVGDRVLDIGCGFGDTTLRLAEMVGPAGTALGVDAAPRFIESAREDAAVAGTSNVRLEVVDVETADFDEGFDYAFSRFGTMFFANPVAALRNVRRALVPGGRLCMVVWRRKLENEWLHRAELVVKELVEEPEESDEPTCGPGPFSMADADTTSEILMNALVPGPARLHHGSRRQRVCGRRARGHAARRSPRRDARSARRAHRARRGGARRDRRSRLVPARAAARVRRPARS